LGVFVAVFALHRGLPEALASSTICFGGTLALMLVQRKYGKPRQRD
jgi:hypothetical protein